VLIGLGPAYVSAGWLAGWLAWVGLAATAGHKQAGIATITSSSMALGLQQRS
jgi:hypothetical protein